MKIYQSKSGDNSSETNKSQPLFSRKKGEESTHLQKKLSEAQDSSSEGLNKETKPGLENFLGFNFSNIKVHNNPASHEAAELIQARAYTTGNHIFLGNEANSMSPIQRKSLLTHEVVHTIQQRSFSPVTIQAKSIIDSPQSSHEQEANFVAHDFVYQHSENYQSTGLVIRRHSRIGAVSSPVIQRDIKDSKGLANGKMELNFKKNDATAKGTGANETGTGNLCLMTRHPIPIISDLFKS